MAKKNKYQVQEIIDTDSNGTPDAAVIKKSTAKGGKIPETPSESETLNNGDEPLVISDTDIFKEPYKGKPYTDEQLARLNDDLFYTKMAEEEFEELQAGDKKAAEFARKIKLKRARELFEGYNYSNSDNEQKSSMGPKTGPGPYAKYLKKGKRGRFSTELDANPEWWDSEPEEADNWWKETLKDADTVDVIEEGPAGGNPMFTLTSNNRDTLANAIRRYDPDASDADIAEWIYEHDSDDGDDSGDDTGDDTELDSTGTMSSTDEDDDSDESMQNIVAALKDRRF